MMKDFLAFAKARRTIYDYGPQRPPASLINYILEVARWSPSCHNTQPWKFVVIKDKKLIQQLIDSSISAAFVPSLPPVVIAVGLRGCDISPANACAALPQDALPEAHICLGTAILNICYAAQSKGWQTGIMSPNIKLANKLLHAEKDSRVPVIIMLGKERKGAFRKEPERKPFKEIVAKGACR